MRVALSPCPNDTFLFHAWLKGEVGRDLPAEPFFADIQQLNNWALEERYPLLKISIGCLKRVLDTYELLPVGVALGYNCGPKIISKIPFSVDALPEKRIAIPGQDTTAHLLLNRLLPPPAHKVFCLYHEIPTLIEQGHADCGLIIHESRFTFAQAGFTEIVDLGTLWHDQTHSPLPLGGLVLTRTTPPSLKERLITILQESLAFAYRYPEKSLPFILEHAQEKDPTIVRAHIDTYITPETASLSPLGLNAIKTLLEEYEKNCSP